MIDYWALGLAYLVSWGGMVAPGPDFLIVMRNALGHSTRAGIFTGLGITLGLAFHMGYCLAGLGIVIAQSAFLFSILKWIGAGYLIYMGISIIWSKGPDQDKLRLESLTEGTAGKTKTDKQAFINGLVTNFFNPKAAMFFIALFSQMIDPQTPFSVQFGFAVLLMVTALFWWSLLSIVMGRRSVRHVYARSAKWIDRIFGGFFIALGAKLALSKL